MCIPASSSRALGAALGAAFACLACQRPAESAPAHAVRVTVERYNQLLAADFRASHADLLAEVAGASELARVSSVIAGLLSQGKRMEARQVELDVIEVRLDEGGTPGTALVRTRERWTYQHLFLGAPESQRAEQREAVYRMTYSLVRIGDRWVVERAAVDPE